MEELEHSPLLLVRDANQMKVLKPANAHHTMDAEEPFTSEFSRWIHGGKHVVAGVRPRRNNEAVAAQYNSCG